MDVDRKRVISAIPKPRCDSQPALRKLSPLAVAHVAADTSLPWWRRQPCARSLEGRVPSEAVPGLWDRVIDQHDVTEVRTAILVALSTWWVSNSDESQAHRTSSLQWLQAQQEVEGGWRDWELALIRARCQLGDLSCVEKVAQAVYDPWAHRKAVGHEALEALCAGSRAGVLSTLGASTLDAVVMKGTSSPLRYLGVAMLDIDGHRESPALVSALADPDVTVAHFAHEVLRRGIIADEVLFATFDKNFEPLQAASTDSPPLTGPGAAACWALMVLVERCKAEEVPDRNSKLSERLEVACHFPCSLSGIPTDIRKAILGEYLPGQRTTDPRFLLEGASLVRTDSSSKIENATRVYRALESGGFDVSPPIPIGEVHQQGDGSFAIIKVSGVELGVCEIGPYAYAESTEALDEEVAKVLRELGFKLIDSELAARTFSGLSVYYFGDREALTVGELLFYWQD